MNAPDTTGPVNKTEAVLDIGRSLIEPTLKVWGTDEQRARFMPGIETRSERWCQLFSEPGAGSDLASLATRAVQRDGVWVVNGQKVWSTLAHVADFGILLARTDPEAPRHAGITCFALDMRQPGVTVRPLRQMTGRTDEFNEVFIEEAVIPDDHRIGPLGAGWKVAATTLLSERGMLSGDKHDGPTRVESLIRSVRDTAWHDPVVRQELIGLLMQERVLTYTRRRAGGSAAAVTKLGRSILTRRIEDMALRLLGPHATAWETDDDEGAVAVGRFLQAQCATIVGGTSDIQRNIVGERMLGLPREPDGQRDLPWNRTIR